MHYPIGGFIGSNRSNKYSIAPIFRKTGSTFNLNFKKLPFFMTYKIKRRFTRKLNKDVLNLYECEAGLSIEERPPLDAYRPDDYDKFIR